MQPGAGRARPRSAWRISTPHCKLRSLRCAASSRGWRRLMAVKPVLRMGDARLLERSREVERFGTPELDELLRDMHDTMGALNGAGLAAPQISVPLRVVVFGVKSNPRYPDAEEVPYTVLINPVIAPLG